MAPGLPDEAYYFCDAYSSFNIQMTSRSLWIFLCVQNEYPLRLYMQLRFMSLSVYAKADYLSIVTNRQGTCPFSLFVQTNSPDVLNWRRQSSRCPGRDFAWRVRQIVLTFFDIFKHLRGLKSVDKIKKYHCDVPWGFSLTLAVDCHLTLRVR